MVRQPPRPGDGDAGGQFRDRQLVFLPLIAELTTRYGWRIALVFVCAALAFTALVALLLMRDRPSDLNLPLYGETVVTPPPAAGAGLASLLMSPLAVLKDAARVPLFWVLFGTFFVCGSSTNGLIQTHSSRCAVTTGLRPSQRRACSP